MSKYIINEKTLTDVAEAIRNARNKDTSILAKSFASEIESMREEIRGLIERNVTRVDIPKGTTNVPDNAFSNYTALANVSVADSVTSIGDSAFAYCAALKSITFGKNSKLNMIYQWAFRECAELTSIIMPDSLTRIEYYAFYNCSKLSEVILSNSMHTMGSHAFRDCTSLSKIFFPKSVISIYDRAFQGCSNCLEYDFSTHEIIPTLSGANVFSGINSNAKIIVPAALYNEWVVSTNWASYSAYITTEA